MVKAKTRESQDDVR